MSEQPFRNIDDINQDNSSNRNESLDSVENLNPTSFAIGKGYKAMFSDERGTWWGDPNPKKAPVHIDMNGNWTLRSKALGGGYILINAELTQFLMNDGKNDRLLIGKQVGGF